MDIVQRAKNHKKLNLQLHISNIAFLYFAHAAAQNVFAALLTPFSSLAVPTTVLPVVVCMFVWRTKH